MTAFVNCINKDMTPEQILGMLLTKTATGEFAIRTMIEPACSVSALDCTTSGLPIMNNLVKAIGISSCGKPAIRLGILGVDMATALGLASYANNGAAVTGGLLTNQAFYNTTTSKVTVVA